MELGLQYEIAELLKSTETKSSNEKNIMRMQMHIQSAETKVIKAKSYSKKALSNEKNITRMQIQSHLTQR